MRAFESGYGKESALPRNNAKRSANGKSLRSSLSVGATLGHLKCGFGRQLFVFMVWILPHCNRLAFLFVVVAAMAAC
jgi:hypothetical protein